MLLETSGHDYLKDGLAPLNLGSGGRLRMLTSVARLACLGTSSYNNTTFVLAVSIWPLARFPGSEFAQGMLGVGNSLSRIHFINA